MPNSRVRALTEKARTPATPTKAMARATAAKTPNTTVLRRSGVRTSARTSSRVAARSTGWSTDMSRMMRVIGVTRGNEFDHGIRPEDVAIDGILIGEHSLSESLTDHNDRFFALAVELIEIAAGDDGNTERGKKAGRDGAQLGARIFFAGGTNVAIRRKLKARAKAAGIPPGNHNAKSGLGHTG